MLKGIADYRPEAIRHLIYYLFTTFHPNEKRYNNLNTAIYRSAGNDTYAHRILIAVFIILLHVSA